MLIKKLLFASLAFILFLSGCTQTEKKSIKNPEVSAQSKAVAPLINMDLFFQSALEGNIDAVKTTLEKGVDVNSVDSNSRTALMLASYNGHESIVQLLLEKKADVNMLDVSSRTALMFAASGPFNATVTALLNADADVNIVDKEEHWSAIMFAASEGQLEVVETLFQHGADLKLQDIDGESAYDFAKANGHELVAEFIKSKM